MNVDISVIGDVVFFVRIYSRIILSDTFCIYFLKISLCVPVSTKVNIKTSSSLKYKSGQSGFICHSHKPLKIPESS